MCPYVKRGSVGVMFIILSNHDFHIPGSTLDFELKVENKLSKWLEMVDCYETKICFGQKIAIDSTEISLWRKTL